MNGPKKVDLTDIHPEIAAFWLSLVDGEKKNLIFGGPNVWMRKNNPGQLPTELIFLLASRYGGAEFAFHFPPDERTRYSEEEILRRIRLRSFQ